MEKASPFRAQWQRTIEYDQANFEIGCGFTRIVSNANLASGWFLRLRRFLLTLRLKNRRTWRSVQRYTMTSKERLVSLIRAVQYLERNQIPGAFVEYGVWRVAV